jgi:hypothetical protein
VHDHLGADLAAGDARASLLDAAHRCRLFLILGASLKSDGLLDLTQEIADIVHMGYGAVVYVDSEPLPKGRSAYNHIDFHLAFDVSQTISLIMKDKNTVSASAPVGHLETDSIPNSSTRLLRTSSAHHSATSLAMTWRESYGST